MNQTSDKMYTTSVRIPEVARQSAAKAARKLGMSRSSFIRFAVMTTISRVERGEV